MHSSFASKEGMVQRPCVFSYIGLENKKMRASSYTRGWFTTTPGRMNSNNRAHRHSPVLTSINERVLQKTWHWASGCITRSPTEDGGGRDAGKKQF